MNKKFSATLFLIGLLAVLSACRTDDVFYANLLRGDRFVQIYDDTRYDFLWVLDNSGSMSARRQFVKDNMQTFLNIMNSRKAVDFQMAVTTTDMFSHAGALVQSTGGTRVVKSISSVNPVADFAAIVDAVTDSPTSFWEQGLESAYSALQVSRTEFARPGVPLIIVFVTDENDYSCMDNCFGIEPENNPNDVVFPVSRYVDYFKTIKETEGSYTYVFPIIGTAQSTCTVASNGERYEEVTAGIGGMSKSGSICNGELRQSYEGIAQVIADRGKVFKLSVPSTAVGIKVFVDSQLIPYSPENFVFDKETNSIVFTGFVPKAGSVIEVTYSQRQS